MDEEMTQEEMDQLIAQWWQDKLDGKRQMEEPTGAVIGPLAGEDAVRFLEELFSGNVTGKK
jgi:hypothetical protein